MTTVSAVSNQTVQAQVATQVPKSDLSEATKKQLEALGIPVTPGMTEAQAQAKIAEVNQQKQAQDDKSGQQDSSEAQVLADAQALASQVGVSYADDDDTSTILDKVGEAIEARLDAIKDNPSPSELDDIIGSFNQLQNLDSQNANIQNINDVINMIATNDATNNKIQHGLQ